LGQRLFPDDKTVRADADCVVGLQPLFGEDLLIVDKGPIRAVEIDQPEPLADAFDLGVIA
jgi:hypothetical protein